ncbi:MAG TPA: hypothetical protein VMM92_08980 [Thermoanaerobaculia bacterium]|nr:hypothetical protein [Thermoanaerobaculia bacterium]
MRVALALAGDSFFLFHQKIPANGGEVGIYSHLERFGAGFWCWLASLAVLFLGSLWLRALARPQDAIK